MPRPSYGPQAKNRTQKLLLTLLDYANDELDGDELALEQLQRQIKTHWKTEQQLVVQTKIRYLEQLLNLAGYSLTGQQIKESLSRLEDFLQILEDNRPSRQGSETWNFTLKLWHMRRDRTAILQRLDEEWENRRPQKSKQVSPKIPLPEPVLTPLKSLNLEETASQNPPILGDSGHDISSSTDNQWLQWCRDNLQEQHIQRLTTNPLTVNHGVTFGLEDLYIPLGLVKQHSSLESDAAKLEAEPDLESSEESGLEKSISPEQLLNQLLHAETPSRIAIVGTPGSGKTTLLQRIATELLNHQRLPIWISLADLQGETLDQYLLNTWLKIVTRKIVISQELQEELGNQFNQGHVYLLLDAVDEMGTEATLALAALARQLRGWIADAHIVLTCRLNIWGAGKNPLEHFTTYQNLGFQTVSQVNRNQVEQFIQKWFQAESELGVSLCSELKKPERKRIRDTIKNPLCLALLCRTWTVMQGNLPNTKSALYQQVVQTIYEWKQDRFPTTLAQRQQLNQILARLALQTFSQEKSRFRLSQTVVEMVLESNELELFSLALQLGWLNPVGTSTETGDRLYAFYHSTFQEYFAAQGIEDWQVFFTEINGQPPIFSIHWREVILLWLGRSDVATTDKESLIQALVKFEDYCGGFYHHQAYFLAAEGLAEFSESHRGQTIVNQLIHWYFGEFDPQQKKWSNYPAPILNRARTILFRTDRTTAIACLETYAQSVNNLLIRRLVAYSLGKNFDPGNSIAVATLLQLLEVAPDAVTQMEVAYNLGQLSPEHPLAIFTLRTLLELAQQDAGLKRKVAYRLGRVYPSNSLATDTLVSLIQSSSTPLKIKARAMKDLSQIAPDHPILSSQVLPQDSLDTLPRSSSRRGTRKANQHIRAIEALEEKLATHSEPAKGRRYALSLLKLQPGHPQAVAALIHGLKLPQTQGICRRTIELLQQNLLEEQLTDAVMALKHDSWATQPENRSPQSLEIYKLLWYCTEQMSYAQFRQAWQSLDSPVLQ
ncbi:MAG: NACHT domain-containing protein [Microcoleaceae cyanobacterium]